MPLTLQVNALDPSNFANYAKKSGYGVDMTTFGAPAIEALDNIEKDLDAIGADINTQYSGKTVTITIKGSSGYPAFITGCTCAGCKLARTSRAYHGPKTLEQVEIDKHVEMLNALGQAHAIAEFFIEQGIKAVPGNNRRCAIAVWLQKVSGRQFAVYGGGIVMTDTSYPLPLPAVSQHVRDFMSDFDRYRYPQLMA